MPIASAQRTGQPSLDPRLVGVCPVIETPFLADGDVDIDSFRSLVGHVASTGVTSMMFPGFASEFHKLSDAEVDLLTREFIVAAGPDVFGVVSIPTHSTLLACRSAERAAELGAAALNVLPPYFLGPSDEAIVAHIAAVAAAVDPVPIIVQYAPAQTGAALTAEIIEGIAAGRPNLLAVKVESSPPGDFIQDLAALSTPIAAFVGYAGLSLPGAVRAGAIGVQPGCSFTELYVTMWALYSAGDLAGGDRVHARMRPYLQRWMDGVEHIVAVEKEVSMRRGLIATNVVREPGRRLAPGDLADIDDFLADFSAELAPVVTRRR